MINELDGIPQYETQTGAASETSVMLQVPVGEIWVVHWMSAKHDDNAAARDTNWRWHNKTTSKALNDAINIADGVYQYLFEDIDWNGRMIIDYYNSVGWEVPVLGAGKKIYLYAAVTKFKGTPVQEET